MTDRFPRSMPRKSDLQGPGRAFCHALSAPYPASGRAPWSVVAQSVDWISSIDSLNVMPDCGHYSARHLWPRKPTERGRPAARSHLRLPTWLTLTHHQRSLLCSRHLHASTPSSTQLTELSSSSSDKPAFSVQGPSGGGRTPPRRLDARVESTRTLSTAITFSSLGPLLIKTKHCRTRRMTRAPAWNSCNRVLDERWHESQWQAHRDRVELIQSASSVSVEAFSSALAASAQPPRIHTSRAHWNSSSTVKLVSRSKSPAAKSRQKQIDRDNLLLIKKIIALDNAKAKAPTPRSGAKKKRVIQPKATVCAATRSNDKNTIVVPEPVHSSHECLHPLPDVPQSAASHALYTRGSATMKNNFVEYNAPTMLHASNATSAAARVRSRAQSRILDENRKILRRILTARTTVDRSELERHEEKHNKLRTIMSRHHSTSKLPQQQSQHHPLQTSRSQSNLPRNVSDDAELFDTLQAKRRPRSASQSSSRARVAASCSLPLHSARKSVSSESLVSRMRKMTIENQH